ncbi:hypothetical protein DNTS_023629 [Danionella cerebrum]|uniref:Ig-like domain-containing protein n=1 Tax=Danionella cerebrum TaxID=2873325 RepID=A0A553QK42_9TELE|nr:hypothetical protein DNTS_023629 [Danionella translucida]
MRIMNSRLFPLIQLLILVPGSLMVEPLPVNCRRSVCAEKGSEVRIWCFYSNTNVKSVFWFNQKQSNYWRNKNEPEDLTLDSEYSGRVKFLSGLSGQCPELIISEVTEQDSGEYRLIFIMDDGVKRYASAAVDLTVTDLQVKINPPLGISREDTVVLTCDGSCDTGKAYTYWQKDGQLFTFSLSRNITVSITKNPGSYSCYETIKPSLSPSVCVSQSVCWNVAYSSTRVCSLEGSTVEISSSYSHPSGFTVTNTLWSYGEFRVDEDLREEDRFAGRVEYEENKLRIKELKMDDSGQYQFRIITDKAEGKFSGSPGVILTVTDLQVTSHPDATADGKVILSCATRCTLSEKHTFIWYKNGRRVTEGFTKANKLYLDSISSEELQEFSCVVADQERTALRNAAVVFCVILSLALTGALWYSCRRFTCFKTHSAEMEHVQDDTVYNNISPEMKGDAENQDMHYSTIEFETHPPSTVKQPAPTTETENVCYAAVMVR